LCNGKHPLIGYLHLCMYNDLGGGGRQTPVYSGLGGYKLKKFLLLHKGPYDNIFSIFFFFH
jgi:hypothetical protein